MPYSLTIVTAPAIEPVTITELKQQIDSQRDDQDALLARLIQAAREKVCADTGRALIDTSLDLRLDAWPNGTGKPFYLPVAPVRSVTGITYFDYDGNTVSVGSSNYTLVKSEPARIYPHTFSGYTWPDDYRTNAGGINVVFVAGYGAAATTVPAMAKQAILLLASHWYENREALIVGTISAKAELAYESLIASLRIGDEFMRYDREEVTYPSRSTETFG